MTNEEFRKRAHELVDWIADYRDNVEAYPAMSLVRPKEILEALPSNPPLKGEGFDAIFGDFKEVLLKGMTHWQHPSFFAYFPSNASYPSLLGEMLASAMGAQCMIWQTSPAAAELEERVMEWLREMMGIPANFTGVIQDTASTGILVALLTAREKASQFKINQKGFEGSPVYRVYCSEHTHSSIDKAVKIAGIGIENLVKIAVDENFAMLPAVLEAQIESDVAAGFVPLMAVATVGTTSSTAMDPVRTIGELCQKHGLWLHVDAAYAGTATILPEHRHLIDGLDLADSYLFNPHKWMLTNFDCTAYYVKDKGALIQTFEILPEYLKTQSDEGKQVNNYRDWGIQLGRRFRALKLWFVIRSYGVEGIQNIIREHVALGQSLADKLQADGRFELLAPVPLNLVCFRYKPAGMTEDAANSINAAIMHHINATGKAYLTHTKLNGNYTLRVVVGQIDVTQQHLDAFWGLLENALLSCQ